MVQPRDRSFNIFLNDIFLNLVNEVDVYNYADDNTFVCHGDTYEEAKQKLCSNLTLIKKS